jgi:hypothetical protein
VGGVGPRPGPAPGPRLIATRPRRSAAASPGAAGG